MAENIFKRVSSNIEAGYLVYSELTDTKTPTPWKNNRKVRLVLKTPNRTKRGDKTYYQTPKGQDELSRDFLELHNKIYEKRLNIIK